MTVHPRARAPFQSESSHAVAAHMAHSIGPRVDSREVVLYSNRVIRATKVEAATRFLVPLFVLSEKVS